MCTLMQYSGGLSVLVGEMFVRLLDWIELSTICCKEPVKIWGVPRLMAGPGANGSTIPSLAPYNLQHNKSSNGFKSSILNDERLWAFLQINFQHRSTSCGEKAHLIEAHGSKRKVI